MSGIEQDVPGIELFEAPAPRFTVSRAEEVARRLFGFVGTASALESELDQNFLLTEGDREPVVLKVSNGAADPAVIDMQTAAVLHVARVDPELPVARPLPAIDGGFHPVVEGTDAKAHRVRLFTFVPGSVRPASELTLESLFAIGACAARLGRALRGFFHPAAGHLLLWDVRHLAELRPLLSDVDGADRRAIVAAVLDRFEERVAPAFPRLRAQAIHGDLSVDNALMDDDGLITGIVDFGDMSHTALLCDLAAVVASVLAEREDTFEAADAVIRGYGSITPLEQEEAELFADLLGSRLATSVLISAWRVRRHPENAAYITGWDKGSWGLLELFDELGPERMRERFIQACAPAPAIVPRAPAGRSAPPVADDELLERRRRVLGTAATLSYKHPLHLVRGRGAWVFDPQGRRYLDAYNNVPVVGHSHPRVVDAIARQAATLNTNTRYLHENVVELAERLTSSMPEGLDTCVFVNSGSEANDLAWRLATAATGAGGGIVTAFAYHGVTSAIAELSPEEWPGGAGPAHVATIPAPDGFRGKHPREEPGWEQRYASGFEDAMTALEARGVAPAAVMIDAGFTSDGVFDPPAGYLREVVRRTHEAGALFVADEVQAGFGRTGTHLWAFEGAGVAPDVVTLGKPMGNGHPIAAVLTRADILERLAGRTEFFSTFGGNPVACAAGLAVLDVIEDENIPTWVVRAGAHLRAGLEGLMARHELIGEVRGPGLLIGVELVRDRRTREPASREAGTVVEAMRERGVLIGSTGPQGNVLKIRPPLVIALEQADLLVETLDRVLSSLR
jgi:4-aminobutyrate aminotransferase-like enzyme/Ser/Thr protein kinase RdoA (MazF antagonist)